ncbi:hypothetical protein EJB05_13863, partial [Eragrostis curvula]
MGIDVPTRTFFASVPGKSTRHRHCRLPRKQELPPPSLPTSSQARAAAVMSPVLGTEVVDCGGPMKIIHVEFLFSKNYCEKEMH